MLLRIVRRERRGGALCLRLNGVKEWGEGGGGGGGSGGG